MEEHRQKRSPGSSLLLGGIVYRLEAVEGYGSSAIVYRATYPDQLNRDIPHRVLIKELFPLTPHGEIYRTPSGEIACTPDGQAAMEWGRQRFRTGNQVNLELLGKMPAGVAGNLNSYEAYGTYYSVLSVHGGVNLLHLLEERGQLPLEESVSILLRLLDEVEGFHRYGLLHLDISPDNILLLPGQAFLIDFNSVWDTLHDNPADFAFSQKPGYSPPEILLKNMQEIGPATDLYACCAVLFHLLSGRRLRQEEIMGNLRKTLPSSLPCLKEIPQTAAAKLLQILTTGLHTLTRRRFQRTEDLREELLELMRRLKGFGVTKSALWETSAALKKRQLPEDHPYLLQSVFGQEGVLTQSRLDQLLTQHHHFLLTGPGGMGKTRLLQELWKKHTALYRPDEPVYWYLSLREYQAAGGEHFIQQQILQALRFSPETPSYQNAIHALEGIFDQFTGKAAVVLLLDGLNEAGPSQEKLLLEIESLSRRPGVSILVTDRSDGVLGYGLDGFSCLTLAPLEPSQVKEQLAASGLSYPQPPALCQLLTNPMMLFLYLDAVQNGGVEEAPQTQEALVRLYLEKFERRALRADSGSQGRQLCTRFLLRYLLPDLAAEMKKRGTTLLSPEELDRIAGKSYAQLQNRSFASAFPLYRGKTRLMFDGIANASEWYDFAVRERLMEQFGLLVETDSGHIRLLHDNFLPVLAAQGEDNRRKLQKSWGAIWRKRIAAAMAAALILLTGWAAAMDYRRTRNSYSPQDNAVIYDALSNLSWSLGVWSQQITVQQTILREAAISDVLDNQDARARDQLSGQIDRKQAQLSALYASPLDADLDQELRAIAKRLPLFSVDRLADLTGRFEPMGKATQQGLDLLQEYLCTPDSLYNTRDKRERLIYAYQDYLDAEVQYVSYQLASLLADTPPEQQSQVLEALRYQEAFSGFYDGPGSVVPERLDEGLAQAETALRAARNALHAEGILIQWETETLDPSPESAP